MLTSLFDTQTFALKQGKHVNWNITQVFSTKQHIQIRNKISKLDSSGLPDYFPGRISSDLFWTSFAMDQRSVSVNSDIPRRFRSRSPIVRRRDRDRSPMSFDWSPYRNNSPRNQSFGGPIDDGYDHRPRQEDFEVIREISAPAHAVVRANLWKEVRGWLVTPISPTESKSIAEASPWPEQTLINTFTLALMASLSSAG